MPQFNDTPSILVVDDDPAILSLVRTALEGEGYHVSTAVSGQQAIAKLARELPNLAIVDLNLPDISGFEVCKRLQQYATIPVIMVTGVDDDETRIQGINQYVEDYVTKPFNPRVLVARVRRILRRFGEAPTIAAEMIIDEALRVNFGQHWVETHRQRTELTPTESKLLYTLIRHAGQVLTTDSLLARVWNPDEEVYVEGLRVHIRRLREKVEPNPARPTYILTERGVGYRFRSTVA